MTKLVLAFLLSAFLVAATGRGLLEAGESFSIEQQSDHGRPKLERPAYKVLNETDELQIREYENATWAVAFGRSRWSTDLAALQAGFGLAAYFKGANLAHEKINRTVPIVGTVLGRPPHHPPHRNGSHPRPPPHKNGSHPKPPPPPGHPPGPPAVAIAGFIPKGFEGNPPTPDSKSVKIIHSNTTKVYVHRFGGWAISWVVGHEIHHLAMALKEEGVCPRKGKFFVATYNGPWKFRNRHNEIWWVKVPKHHNSSEDTMDWMFDGDYSEQAAAPGLEALDVEQLFPEEFPVFDAKELPEMFNDSDAEDEWSTQDGSDEGAIFASRTFEGQYGNRNVAAEGQVIGIA